jgi:hypothetical protein
MQCDQKLGIRSSRVDFCQHLWDEVANLKFGAVLAIERIKWHRTYSAWRNYGATRSNEDSKQ